MYSGYYFKCINNAQGCGGVLLVFYLGFGRVEHSNCERKPCHRGYSQEETKLFHDVQD